MVLHELLDYVTSLTDRKVVLTGTRWAVDLAFFAEAAYFDPLSNDTAEFISTIFDNELGNIHVYLPALNTKTGSKLDFFEAYIPKLNTSVISVRGTDIWRFTDFVEDVKMFFEPVVSQYYLQFFPPSAFGLMLLSQLWLSFTVK
ncbi:unnamed protein product [Phytophthora lilii]|uniref:Unnamed protein product n=1 Tax=Phytophthora lilii TaxID=2077276 RepID=A0A9W6XJM2_9STRA|nr:unnamed protein product [Phytophthora lilii]